MPKPLFLLVSPDPENGGQLAADLERRYGADYRIELATGVPEALALLDRVESLALVIADPHLGGEALELMAGVHTRFPAAKRVLLVDRGDWAVDNPVIGALATGQVDFHLYRPWAPLERILYPAVSDFLATWDVAQEPTVAPLRIVGARGSARAHELRDVLTRIGVPYWYYDAGSDEGQRLLAEVGEDGSRLPVVCYFRGNVLVDPSHAELMAVLGVRTSPSAAAYDVAIVGAGPAGLAAAVYAASEGLHTVVLERVVTGGQAGTSSLIRNYLGFQRGVSGAELANRATEQAWLFGAEFVLDQRAVGLSADGPDRVLRTAAGATVSARAVIVATGVSWRRLAVHPLEALVGAGVFYGAASAEARAMARRDVFVVGAGNSAGQAALHLARYANSVTMLVRGPSLAATMSEYLITEIEKTPNVAVRLRTEVVDGGGAGFLEWLGLRTEDGAVEKVPAAALFLLIGALPHTDWLAGALAREDRGFVLTGRDVAQRPQWPLDRAPHLLETTMPGVFAAGDVRHRSVKRVASAVGEGATAIQLVHEYLSE